MSGIIAEQNHSLGCTVASAPPSEPSGPSGPGGPARPGRERSGVWKEQDAKYRQKRNPDQRRTVR